MTPLEHCFRAPAVVEQCLISCRYGGHISEQTNSILLASCVPMTVKNSRKLSVVRSLPTHSSRVHVLSIW